METCKNVGVELWQARQARGLSRKQMAGITKLRLGQLEAIESNDFAALPAPVFVRGLLRLYAYELGLDPDDIASRYMAQFATDGTPASRMAEAPRTLPSRMRFTAPFARVAMFALLVIVGLLFLNAPGARLRSVAATTAPTPGLTAGPAKQIRPEPPPSFASVAARSRSIANAHLGQ